MLMLPLMTATLCLGLKECLGVVLQRAPTLITIAHP